LPSRQVQAEDVGLLEEGLPALRDLETLRTGARRRAFTAPAHDLHPERPSDPRHCGPNVAEGVDAQRIALESRADGRVPVSLLEALHLEGQVAQRREDQSPRERSEEHTSELQSRFDLV